MPIKSYSEKASVSYGTTADTACEGNDARLSDARTPLPHTIASHSDTTATGTELNTLTNGSNADSLHVHSGGFSDPMTTRGDIIYRDSSNNTDRLSVGASSTLLSSDGTDVAWGETVSSSSGNNTIVKRHSSGYIYCNYYNGTGTFAISGTTTPPARFTGTNGSDTFGRSYTASAAADAIRDYLWRDTISNTTLNMFIQTGYTQFDYSGETATFDIAYSATPRVIATSQERGVINAIESVSTTGVVIRLQNYNGGTVTKYSHWLAIGRKD